MRGFGDDFCRNSDSLGFIIFETIFNPVQFFVFEKNALLSSKKKFKNITSFTI